MGRATSRCLLLRLQRDRELHRLLAACASSGRLRGRDEAQLRLRLQSHFGLYQELHARRADLDDGVWRAAARVLAWLALDPLVSRWWRENGHAFAPAFAAEVASIQRLAPNA